MTRGRALGAAATGLAVATWVALYAYHPAPRWQTVFTGYGSVQAAGAEAELAPAAAGAAEVTHAALVTTRASYGAVTIRVELRTEQQLRTPAPNPWEVGWVLWHLADPQHFYAVTLKPNGWELSKQVPGAVGGQQFLASGTAPRFPVGAWHSVTVTQRGQDITIRADGEMLVRYTDSAPYTSGAVGLYTEDARVAFRRVRITKETA